MQIKYSNFIKSLNLIDISIGELSFKKINELNPKIYKTMNASIKTIKNSYKYLDDSIFLMEHQTSFNLIQSNIKDKRKKNKVFELKVNYHMKFQNSLKLDKEIFDLFSKNNIPLNINPYLRELIQSSLLKAGLPSITLPLIKNVK